MQCRNLWGADAVLLRLFCFILLLCFSTLSLSLSLFPPPSLPFSPPPSPFLKARRACPFCSQRKEETQRERVSLVFPWPREGKKSLGFPQDDSGEDKRIKAAWVCHWSENEEDCKRKRGA
jgi:hypothetical protein